MGEERVQGRQDARGAGTAWASEDHRGSLGVCTLRWFGEEAQAVKKGPLHRAAQGTAKAQGESRCCRLGLRIRLFGKSWLEKANQVVFLDNSSEPWHGEVPR